MPRTSFLSGWKLVYDLSGIICLDLSFPAGDFPKNLEESRGNSVSKLLCRMDVIPRLAISVVVIVDVRTIIVGLAVFGIQLNGLVELGYGRIIFALLPKGHPTITVLGRFVQTSCKE